MSNPQLAGLKVTPEGIVFEAGGIEITLSPIAARQLLEALPAMLKALEAIQSVDEKVLR